MAVPGKWMSGLSVPEDDAVDLLGGDPGVIERAAARRTGRDRSSPSRRRRDVAALFDAGALADPLVVRVALSLGLAHVLLVEERQLLVGDDAVGNVGAVGPGSSLAACTVS
jgi:hypothetical protein